MGSPVRTAASLGRMLSGVLVVTLTAILPAAIQGQEPDDSSEIALILRAASQKWHQGDAAGAVIDLTRGVELWPDNADLLNERALARASLGELEEALADAQAAVAAAENQAAPPETRAAFLDTRGYIHLLLGRNPEAVADYDASARLQLIPEALLGRGLALAALGEEETALKDIDRGLRLTPLTRDPTDPDPQLADLLSAALALSPDGTNALHLPEAPGAIIIEDDFSYPAASWLPQLSHDPEFSLAHDAGEYVIRIEDPESDQVAWVSLPGIYTDASLRVDVRLAGETDRRYVSLFCRNNDHGHYRASFDLQSNTYTLWRWQGEGAEPLVRWSQVSEFLGVTAWNRLELSCAATRLSLYVNSTLVASVFDGSFEAGTVGIGAGRYPGATGGTVEARLANLALTQPRPVEFPAFVRTALNLDDLATGFSAYGSPALIRSGSSSSYLVTYARDPATMIWQSGPSLVANLLGPLPQGATLADAPDALRGALPGLAEGGLTLVDVPGPALGNESRWLRAGPVSDGLGFVVHVVVFTVDETFVMVATAGLRERTSQSDTLNLAHIVARRLGWTVSTEAPKPTAAPKPTPTAVPAPTSRTVSPSSTTTGLPAPRSSR